MGDIHKVRGIIRVGDNIVVIYRNKPDRKYWVLPGGSIEEVDSNPEEALVRECREELGVEVEVGKLVHTEEFNKQIEGFYECKIIDGEIGSGTGPEFDRDSAEYGTYVIELLPIQRAKKINLQPEFAKDLL